MKRTPGVRRCPRSFRRVLLDSEPRLLGPERVSRGRVPLPPGLAPPPLDRAPLPLDPEPLLRDPVLLPLEPERRLPEVGRLALAPVWLRLEVGWRRPLLRSRGG